VAKSHKPSGSVSISPIRARAIVKVSLDFAREWIEFTDPANDEHVVRADLTWLLSRWSCIFGAGCHGIVEGRADTGCCSHGAFFTDKDDEKRVRSYVKKLTPQTCSTMSAASRTGPSWTPSTTTNRRNCRAATARVDGACIFHNREGFPGGSGCALHALALADGQHPLETKPDVVLAAAGPPAGRVDGPAGRHAGAAHHADEVRPARWGPGGHDLHWWCHVVAGGPWRLRPGLRLVRPGAHRPDRKKAYRKLAELCAKREQAGPGREHPATAAARADRS